MFIMYRSHRDMFLYFNIRKANLWKNSKHWSLKKLNDSEQDSILSGYDEGNVKNEACGEKCWNKWKAIKRDIMNNFVPIWAKLCPAGQLPSGKTVKDILFLLRQAYWDKFVTASAKKKKLTMPEDYYPASYESFVTFGPPQGTSQSIIFKAEMSGGPKQKKRPVLITKAAVPILDEEVEHSHSDSYSRANNRATAAKVSKCLE